MKTALRLSLAIAALTLAAPAAAQTVSDTFQVTATVAKTCQLQNLTDLAFGTYDVFSATDLDQTATFEIRCNPNLAYRIQIDPGLNYGLATGYAADRAMTDGTNYLAYRLYRDAGRTQLWGNTLGTDTLDQSNGNGAWRQLTIYGRIPAGQEVPAANYVDATVTLTVNY